MLSWRWTSMRWSHSPSALMAARERKKPARDSFWFHRLPAAPKQKEQWREEQAIAGIAAQCKNAVVKGPKQRDLGNQSIVTVPAQTDEIE